MLEKEKEYVEYIKNYFPQLKILKIVFNFSDGRYNDIVIVNDEDVFKFSRYDWTAAFLKNEAMVTPLVRQNVSIAIPDLKLISKEAAKCNFMQGLPLFRDELLLLKRGAQEQIAEQIGTFLKQLHAIPLETVKSYGIGNSPVNRARAGWLLEYERIKSKVFPYCGSIEKEVIEQTFQPLIENKEFLKFQPALIHADLTPQNFFFDRKKSGINGITGFALAGIGDPAYDVSVLLDYFGETFVRRINRYDRNIAGMIDRARFFTFTNHLTWYKKIADMITTRDFTQFHLLFSTGDVMPIGRKW